MGKLSLGEEGLFLSMALASLLVTERQVASG